MTARADDRPSGDVVWAEATERLLRDPAFHPLIERVGPVTLRPRHITHFGALASAIVSQQLAGAAARTIHGRFVEALSGDVTPAAVLAVPTDRLRAAGLSGAKEAAIRGLAERMDAGDVRLDDLDGLADVDVVERLVTVRGIGRWTAEMFLIFQLRRPDVWPVGDLGVRGGFARVMGLAEAPTPKELAWAGTGYRPWRSALAWYCWRAAEGA